ncbi:MAG: ATP-dependent DNA ligase [Candidatus Dojkabacteria bacterium]|nr:ATP-dependent DNA ligase [Candidatus Dojkabacteria bacterium]
MRTYLELCTLFEKVESLQSRTEMSLEIANFFKKCSGKEVEIISYMIQGRVAPFFVNAEFNYSEKSLINMLEQYTSLDINQLRKESGDIGDTMSEVWEKRGNKSKSLDILGIYEILWNIINTTGTGSVSRKNKIVIECLQNLNPLESKYFVRTICGELRLGLSTKTLLEVFSITAVGDKGLKQILEQAYGVCADIGYIGGRVVESNGKDLENIRTTPGIPVLSRLVQRVGSFEELKERFLDNVYVQPKFDGLRCQIHKWDESKVGKEGVKERVWHRYLKPENGDTRSLFGSGESNRFNVRLFTRNLEDVTEMFPEIVEYARGLKQNSFIMDSEIVGWNYKKEKFLSYQETMQRRRKYSIESKREDIPVKAFVFDLLFLEGKSLVSEDTKERISLLKEVIRDTQGGIVLAESKVVSVGKDVEEYFNMSVEKGLEGIIVKDLKGGYRPGARNYEWIKMKKSMDKELVDTIDMVVVGYYKGSGRRSEFGLGAILGAIYNEELDVYDAICKIGTGMKDDMLRDLNSKLSQEVVDKSPKDVRVGDTLKPDVWVVPKYTITVDADEITKNISTTKELIGGGLSLRFPRLIEFDRDKSVEDITSVSELIAMYSMRKKS